MNQPQQPKVFAAVSYGLVLSLAIPMAWYCFFRMVCLSWVEMSTNLELLNIMLWMICAVVVQVFISMASFMMFIGTLFTGIDYYEKFIEPYLQKTHSE